MLKRQTYSPKMTVVPQIQTNDFMSLSQNGKIQAQYIWIGCNQDIRAKTRTLNTSMISSLSALPCWNFDGSSTGQAEGNDSEIWLKPVKYCKDPFRGGENVLVLCECLNASTMKKIASNKRRKALAIFEHKEVKQSETWFGLEQEYTMFEGDGVTPLGWPRNGYPAPQGPYYCGVGARHAFGRELVEAHYRCCLYAGLNISGINAEVMPGQWEFQIGPCEGIDSGDQVWLARFILVRVAENFGVSISFEPKPIKGDWNGAGMHTNYSTKKMREKGGFKEIISAVEKLGKSHKKHMECYGDRNEDRLTGKHETAHFSTFRYGVADRGASIRIPRQTEMDQCGYFEDRRPAANCDPYQVTSLIAETTIVN